MKLRLLTLAAFIVLSSYLTSQNPLSGIINHYYLVSDFECDTSILLVPESTGLSAGDLVLLIQMKGGAVSLANNSTFGNMLSTGNTGNYEFNRVESISPGKVRLRYKVSRPYDVLGNIQLVRVPEYGDVTAQNLTCQAWDGETGGVLVLDVAGTLTLEGNIDVSNNGFRGAQAVDTDNAGSHETNYFYPVNPMLAGPKGEGITDVTSNLSYGRGKVANAGGGGNAHNAGGGGGGNAGAGGDGGLEYYNTPGQPTMGTNGIGGLKLFESDGTKAILGGGGGAGHVNDNMGVSGGNGGGIIIIRTNAIKSNGFKLLANGGDVSSPGTNRNDGQGGGGAGGTMLLQTNQMLDVLNVELKGGNGGDCLFYVNSQIIGPGGGGGGGKFVVNQAFPNPTWNISGGFNGIANQNLSNGAMQGQPGTVLTNVLLWPQDTIPLITEIDTSFCPGSTITIDGVVYSNAGIVADTLNGASGCDSIVRYTLTLLPYLTRADTITFCAGGSVTIVGQVYSQSGTVVDTIPGTVGCDTIVTYTLIMLPKIEVFNDIALCPGQPFTYNGVDHFAPGEFIVTLTNQFGCDSIIHYGLLLLPQPTRAETLKFCPGESIVIGGQTYTQAGTVIDTIPAATGCDTIVTYTLISLLPAPSVVTVHCPNDISIIANPGTAPIVIDYAMPTAMSNCPCPGLNLSLTAGLASGAAFPNGITQVCYKAEDACGHSATCCFKVTVREIQPCDVKVIGCMRYELLSITADAGHNLTYRIKVTNSCPNKLIYTAIELPPAVTATTPANLSLFTAASGRTYDVRNPNFSPFYSIRFKSTTDSISNGQSDVFEYTLPAQSAPNYMDITSRLSPQLFFEAYLNTFNCPIGVTKPGNRSDDPNELAAESATLFPNPSSGVLWVDLGERTGKDIQWRILNIQGQQVLESKAAPEEELLQIDLPEQLPNGLFFFELRGADGKRQTLRFVVQY